MSAVIVPGPEPADLVNNEYRSASPEGEESRYRAEHKKQEDRRERSEKKGLERVGGDPSWGLIIIGIGPGMVMRGGDDAFRQNADESRGLPRHCAHPRSRRGGERNKSKVEENKD